MAEPEAEEQDSTDLWESMPKEEPLSQRALRRYHTDPEFHAVVHAAIGVVYAHHPLAMSAESLSPAVVKGLLTEVAILTLQVGEEAKRR